MDSRKPLIRSDSLSCYRSATRPMQVALAFTASENRRELQSAYFSEGYDPTARAEARTARNQAFVDRLLKQFGKPMLANDGDGLQTLYWGIPGGLPDLLDMISTTLTDTEGANVTLTSMRAASPAPAEQKSGGPAAQARQ